jgi:hypothetical protein
MVLIPITCPLRSISGPPLLPGLMAASVWMSVTSPAWRMALTMPRVTVFDRTPSAEPIAITSWPTRAPWAEPRRSVAWPGLTLSTFSTAKSMAADVLTTRAVYFAAPACSCTDVWASMTWAFVMTVSGRTKNPLPRALPA